MLFIINAPDYPVVMVRGNIPGYDNYYACRCGRIYSLKSNRFLKPKRRRGGYLSVDLCKNGTIKNVSIHKLVAMVYLKNVDNKPLVNHKDGVVTNNSVNNLEWMTYSENTQHAWDTGLRKRKMA